ncbi:MAG: rhodanese-like domain-containing protein [Pseudohongiellaceae bacterium]
MIEQLFEFVGNHLILVGVFVFLLVAFFVNESKQGGAVIATGGLVTLINREDALVLDVRDSKDFAQGHIVGAVNIPYGSIDNRMAEVEDFKERPVVVVCKMGQHAGAVGKKLRARGFENVRRLSGGMAEWFAANLPVVKGKS